MTLGTRSMAEVIPISRYAVNNGLVRAHGTSFARVKSNTVLFQSVKSEAWVCFVHGCVPAHRMVHGTCTAQLRFFG